MAYKGYKKIYGFRKFQEIRAFGNDIRTNFIKMHAANDEQNHLIRYIKEFKSKAKPPNNSNLRKVKDDISNSAMAFLKEEK